MYDIDFYEIYPTGDWRDEISPDPFDIEDGITREEMIDYLETNHANGLCDEMLCPVCQFESLRQQHVERN